MLKRPVTIFLALGVLVSLFVGIIGASAHSNGNYPTANPTFLTVLDQRLVAPGVLRVLVEYDCPGQLNFGLYQGRQYQYDKMLQVNAIVEVNANEAIGFGGQKLDTGYGDTNNDGNTDQAVTLQEDNKPVLQPVQLIHDEETFIPRCDGLVHFKFLNLFGAFQAGLFDEKSAVMALVFRNGRGRFFTEYVTFGETREFIH